MTIIDLWPDAVMDWNGTRLDYTRYLLCLPVDWPGSGRLTYERAGASVSYAVSHLYRAAWGNSDTPPGVQVPAIGPFAITGEPGDLIEVECQTGQIGDVVRLEYES